MSTSVTVSLGGDESGGLDAATAQLVVLVPAGRPCGGSSRHLLAGVDVVAIGRGDTIERKRAGGLQRLELRFPDRALSAEHARLTCVRGAWIVEDTGSKNRTRINGVEVQRAALRAGDVLELGQTFLLFVDEPAVAAALDLRADQLAPAAPAFATFSGELAATFDALAAIAPSRVPVVVLGDTGTGKEGVARAVHDLSGRTGPFVAVNCGALPAGLVEAQLFGWKKGAFTGAVEQGIGYVRGADRGTLFLDEIAELTPAAQATLLRVLQEGEVVPVGGVDPVVVDVRVIAATHEDLARRVEAGTFRRDVWARLAGFVVELPALAERRADLGLVTAAILERLGAPASLELRPAAARLLLGHTWPLNIRELATALEAMIALARGGPIDAAQVPPAIRSAVAAPPASAPELDADDQRLRDELTALLALHHGNVAAVARAMGKGRMQIHRWVRRFALDLTSYR